MKSVSLPTIILLDEKQEGVTHKPKLDKRSVKIDRERSNSSPAIPRAEILLEKGKTYES